MQKSQIQGAKIANLKKIAPDFHNAFMFSLICGLISSKIASTQRKIYNKWQKMYKNTTFVWNLNGYFELIL